jgi:hypothetical protein
VAGATGSVLSAGTVSGKTDAVAEDSGSGAGSPRLVRKTVPLPAHKTKANARTVQT